MRTAQKRSIPDTWRDIGKPIGTITPSECANYLANAGYASAKT
jgi:putative transposase